MVLLALAAALPAPLAALPAVKVTTLPATPVTVKVPFRLTPDTVGAFAKVRLSPVFMPAGMLVKVSVAVVFAAAKAKVSLVDKSAGAGGVTLEGSTNVKPTPAVTPDT